MQPHAGHGGSISALMVAESFTGTAWASRWIEVDSECCKIFATRLCGRSKNEKTPRRLAEKEKKNPENCREPDQHPKHPSFAAHKRALKCLARLQYRGMFRIVVLARGATQFRNVKKVLT